MIGSKKSRIALPRDEYHKLKMKVLRRDKHRCRCCGKPNNLHPHHIIYRSQGGDDCEWNLIILCADCHTSLHTRYLVITQDDDYMLNLGAMRVVDANKPVKFLFLEGWKPKYQRRRRAA